jgi:tRNA modification GTPase
MRSLQQETIAAIATPAGEGGIAIIRVSGSEAIEKVEAVFKPRRKNRSLRDVCGYHMILGWIVDEEGQRIDECLLAVMRKPHSYTAEDTVEIHCHGGLLAARQCLQQVLSQQVRLARPGEFTQRAYLNGRLDASQAEAVIEIIQAKSEKALYLATKQLSGHNSRHMHRLEEQMIRVTAMIEASIDFPEEVGEPDYEEIQGLLEEVQTDIGKLLRAGKRAEIYRTGVKIVICGKPNVGKSSWLNQLSGWDRAIVTEIPGTTRDIIEEYINIKGIPVRLVDTAGIRKTEDRVESIGVQIAQQVISEAALAIFILDITSGITEEDQEVFLCLDPLRTIILVNKDDLLDKQITPEQLQARFSGIPVIYGSVKEEQGLAELQDTIEAMILTGQADQDDLEMLLSMRQQRILEECQTQIEAIRDTLARVSLDCLAVEIGMVLDGLGEITGKNLQDEVMERIFRDFCIGK